MYKQDLSFCVIQETYLSNKDRPYLSVKGWKWVFQEKQPKKQAEVAILISNKIGLQPEVIKKDGIEHVHQGKKSTKRTSHF